MHEGLWVLVGCVIGAILLALIGLFLWIGNAMHISFVEPAPRVCSLLSEGEDFAFDPIQEGVLEFTQNQNVHMKIPIKFHNAAVESLPTLPEGLEFKDGLLQGKPTTVQDETEYALTFRMGADATGTLDLVKIKIKIKEMKG
jgi:hypothetical protein